MKFYVIKPPVTVTAFFLFSIGLLISIALLAHGVVGGMVLFLLAIVFITYFAYNGLTKKVIIDAHGVKYISLFKRYEINWDDLYATGILYGRHPVIYFTTYTDLKQKLANREPMRIDGNFFKMSYRKKAREEINKYWHTPIGEVTIFGLLKRWNAEPDRPRSSRK